MNTYEEFKEDIGWRESRGEYLCMNAFGFLGKYQFGMARLCDLGLARRKPGRSGFANHAFEFVPPNSLVGFLNDAALQDACFDRHVQDLKRRIKRFDCSNVSGAIAAAHLLGMGGLSAFLKNGIDGKDGLGTKISEYYELFRGYEIP